jgi:trigger factor
MQNQAMDLAMAASSFESLDPQVDLEFQLQMEEINEALKQGNMTLADYTAMFGMDEESFNSFMRADIENRLKVTLTAEAIAKAENLEVDDDARLEVAKVYGLENIEDLVARYGQEAVDEAARNVKVMDFLLANAKMVEEETSADGAETAAAEESSEAGEASEAEETTKAE